jgi:hypothetical protein
MRVSGKTSMDPGKTCGFLEKQAWTRKRHEGFWNNTRGSVKGKRVSGGTRMDLGKTCVFLEKHAWIRENHACFRKNKHGPGKDKRVSRRTGVYLI